MAWFTSCVSGDPADEGYEIVSGDSSADEDYPTISDELGDEGFVILDVSKPFMLPARSFGRVKSTHTYTHERARAVDVSLLGDRICRQVVGYNLGEGNYADNARSNECLMQKNTRVEIPDRQILPGGEYRGIVKLLVETVTGASLQGTAVLIYPDVIVVAGHLLDTKKGHAVKVTAVAGHGSTGDEYREERQGTCAVMHYAWYRKRARANDIGFVHLESAFNEKITPIPFKQTPESSGNVTVKVIAFSGDLSKCAVSKSPLEYKSANGSESGLNVGVHWADTTNGASGGAVLDEKGFLVALHTGTTMVRRSGIVTPANRAVVVDREGNDFGRLLYALKCQHKSLGMADSVILALTNPAYAAQGCTPTLSESLEDGRLENHNGRVYGWQQGPCKPPCWSRCVDCNNFGRRADIGWS